MRTSQNLTGPVNYNCIICLYNLDKSENLPFFNAHSYTRLKEMNVCQPEAVAGPTPFRKLSSAIAAWTSGRRLKAFLEHFSTVSSLLEATNCCSLGRNFPLWKGNQQSCIRKWSTFYYKKYTCRQYIFVGFYIRDLHLLSTSTALVSPAPPEWCVFLLDLKSEQEAPLGTYRHSL